MRTVSFDKDALPAIGMGSWNLGQGRRSAKNEITAIQAGLDIGLKLIDSAEMYGDGASESLIGRAILGRRDSAFIVSKVYPFNAGGKKLIKACEDSLQRLQIEALDLYLLHWAGDIPIEETIAGFESLQHAGKIQRWGVSNLDINEIQEIYNNVAGGHFCATNQVLYNLDSRGIDYSMLSWCRRQVMPVMAYSPLGSGNQLIDHPVLQEIAQKHGVATATVALAWVIRGGGVIAIPESGCQQHVLQNAQACQLILDDEDLTFIDSIFEPPTSKQYLDIL
ncbi:diketogulonate reductase-like aldo/keto reductase [Providencia alcalifaciens]|nr:diketogulonate reductase-like aldo/keto reductase [Providencia alcalifaciens]